MKARLGSKLTVRRGLAITNMECVAMELQSTRQQIVTLRSKYPSLPAVRIAELLSVSRERVRQILKAEGLPTRVRPYYGECKRCSAELSSGRKTYCSVECRSADCRISFRCDYCGQDKQILQSVYHAQKKRGYNYMYCSISCRNFGKWNVYKLGTLAVSVS